MNDFNIKKFLTENKMTRNSRLLSEEKDYDLDGAFKNSPSQAPYEDVLEIVKSYEDIEELNKFKSRFPETQPTISKKDYYEFAYSSIDDMSEIDNIKTNWINIFR